MFEAVAEINGLKLIMQQLEGLGRNTNRGAVNVLQ
jgi:hypothetical protein